MKKENNGNGLLLSISHVYCNHSMISFFALQYQLILKFKTDLHHNFYLPLWHAICVHVQLDLGSCSEL